jgi:hypothetical protein
VQPVRRPGVTSDRRRSTAAQSAVLASVLAVLVLAACGTSPATTPVASTSTIPAVETPQQPPLPDATATNPPVGATVQARVTEFEVWQDYMPIVPPDGAPLYGFVTVAITNTEKLTPQIAQGTITLTQPGGDTIVEDMPLTLQQQSDDLGMLTPGPQSVVFTFGPGTTQLTLTEGEMAGGRLALTVGGEQVQLDLPPVALYFTH